MILPHIQLPPELPGISAAMAFRKETAQPLRELAHVLLHEPNSLTPGERELIATYVSSLNGCQFCQASHGAAAACHLGNSEFVRQVKVSPDTAPISAKLKRLLGIAAQIQRGGKYVSSEDIAAARSEGATDMEIHDTVLIAAAFCMYNRYVDGLATIQPEADEAYIDMGRHLAKHGYIQSSQTSIAVITNSEIE